MLSGKKLLDAIKSQSAIGLVDKRGQKSYSPDGSWLEGKWQEVFHHERRQTIEQERIKSMGSVVQAEWIAEEKRVKLSKAGKFIKTMGYVENSHLYLLPEEALFLVDEGSIMIMYKNVVLTVEECFSILLDDRLNVGQYQVFAHFTRLGYILRPFVETSSTTKYERQLKLDMRAKRKGRKSKRKSPVDVSDPANDDVVSAKVPKIEKCRIEAGCGDHGKAPSCNDAGKEASCDILGKQASCDIPGKEASCDIPGKEAGYDDHVASFRKVRSEPIDSYHKINHRSESPTASGVNTEQLTNSNQFVYNTSSSLKVVTRSEPLPGSSWDSSIKSEQSFVMSKHSANEQSFSAAKLSSNDVNEQLFPVSKQSSDEVVVAKTKQYTTWDFDDIDFPDICQSACVYKFKLKPKYFPISIQLSERICAIQITHTSDSSDELEFSQGSSGSKQSLGCRNWTEYKQRLQQMSTEDSLMTSPVGYLWRDDDVTPLIEPREAFNTEAVLKKLKIIENVNYSLPSYAQSLTPVVGQPRICYDGYPPNKNFSKSNPKSPQFRLVILPHSSPVPNLQTFGALTSQSNSDDVPLIWAVVQHGDISFYSFQGIDLPTDICQK